ncbi:LytR C-terminal domain-containing protein [Demequina sp. TTPB684]|uniref:LytR C-terminal domain-containing protein n=1 Tax=unclassified Demequina TaxID=2620311 RepID=UPI001CF3FC51|nr:LytR C-terminal domain-containing protein [Demequina sp. TMPB413]MCB2412805.1 LytR C-terminal domain-containing protein [Demequina sp. TTPB684]UPU87441.1 LytR C-terminal domain-containing protein [Demequina sp. TMPB413]
MPEFPPDEFDAAADERGPVGVHRKRKSWVWAVAAPLVISIAAGALAYGVVVYLWRAQGNDGVPPLDSIPRATITATQAETPEVTTSPSPSPEPSETPSPTPTVEPVQFGAPVVVLNGAGISGLAGANQEKLAAAGFTAATADNLTGTKPASNTVRYSDASLESTAAKVAEVLGITTVEFGVVPEGNLAVLLVTDPAA